MPSQLSPNAELGASEHSTTTDTGRLQKTPGGWPTGHTARMRASVAGLLSCCNPRRNQADVVHASFVAKVDNLGDLAEVEILVALDEHDLLLACRKDLLQFGLEVRLVHRGFVDQIGR